MSQLTAALLLLSTLASTGATRQLPPTARHAQVQPPGPSKPPPDGDKGDDKKDEEDEEEDVLRR